MNDIFIIGILPTVFLLLYVLCKVIKFIYIIVDFDIETKFLEKYEPIATNALKELKEYTRPSFCFTDDIRQQFVSKYQTVAKKIARSKYSSKTTAEFLTKFNSLDEIQQNSILENEKYNKAISFAEQLNKEFTDLFNSNTYINHHRIDIFKKKWEDIDEFIKNYVNYFIPYNVYGVPTAKTIRYLTNKTDILSLVKEHNAKFIESELEQHKQYFDTLFNYPLDEQQRRAIVTSEDNNLIIASAGSGKTSTIVAKARYLIEKCGVLPSEILVVTYTRKAAEELRTRMGYDDVTCSTFHAHALQSLGNITGHKPNLCDSNLIAQTFENLMRNNPIFFEAANNYITQYENRSLYDFEYDTAEQHTIDLQRYGKSVPYLDMDGNRIYVRSREERELCIILTELGVPFRYEEAYPYDTSDNRHRQYKPDFTLHFQVSITTDYGVIMQDRTIYFEHFGIDANGNVPKWFGDGKNGGWETANKVYNAGINWKKDLHNIYGTELIFTTSADFQRERGNMKTFVENLLHENGVPINPLSNEHKRALLKKANERIDDSLAEFLNGFITLMKANRKTIADISNEINSEEKVELRVRNEYILKNLITPLYQAYAKILGNHNQIDFTDLLIHCADVYAQHNPYRYKYILVDEFQDMSQDKYTYLQALRTNEPFTQLFCVGDDWQSIYRFSGSDMTLFYDFEKLFGVTERCKIETTHRFGNPLMRISSQFIQVNPEQQKKNIRTTSTTETELKLIAYKNDELITKISSLIKSIPKEESIYILGRYKSSINVLTKKPLDYAKNAILNIGGHEVRYLTIHSAKGLEADHVFVINCNDGSMPSIIQDDPILNYVLSGADSFEDAEERRVFYVAMTRARKATYLLYNIDKPSYFIGDLGEFRRTDNCTDIVCPHCQRGFVAVTKDSIAKNGSRYINIVCTNRNCDYIETLFEDSSDIYQYIPRIVSIFNESPLSNIDKQINCIRLYKKRRILILLNKDTLIAYYFYIPTIINIDTVVDPVDLFNDEYEIGTACIENYDSYLNCIVPYPLELFLRADNLSTIQLKVRISDGEYNDAISLIQQLSINNNFNFQSINGSNQNE